MGQIKQTQKFVKFRVFAMKAKSAHRNSLGTSIDNEIGVCGLDARMYICKNQECTFWNKMIVYAEQKLQYVRRPKFRRVFAKLNAFVFYFNAACSIGESYLHCYDQLSGYSLTVWCRWSVLTVSQSYSAYERFWNNNLTEFPRKLRVVGQL